MWERDGGRESERDIEKMWEREREGKREIEKERVTVRDRDRDRERERERKKKRKRDWGERGRHDFLLMFGHTGRYKGRRSVYVEYSISEKMIGIYNGVKISFCLL